VNEPEKFILRRSSQEASSQRARDGLGMLFLDTTHHHTEVAGFHDNTHSSGFENAHERVRNVIRESFLDLQAVGKHVYDPGDLRKAYNLSLRDVRNMRLSEERQHVMLAKRIDFYVANEDHTVMRFLENRAVDDIVNALPIPARQPFDGKFHAGWRLQKTFALGIFT